MKLRKREMFGLIILEAKKGNRKRRFFIRPLKGTYGAEVVVKDYGPEGEEEVISGTFFGMMFEVFITTLVEEFENKVA